MTPRIGRWILAGGASLLLLAAGITVWNALREASAVRVMARVVGVQCDDGGSHCEPTLEFVTSDGEVRRIAGPAIGFAGRYEEGAEWMPVHHRPEDPRSAWSPDAPSVPMAVAFLATLAGCALLGLGWAAACRLPPDRRPRRAWVVRAVTVAIGASSFAVALPLLHITEDVVAALSTTITAAVVPAVLLLGRRGYPKHFWPTVAVYPPSLAAFVMAAALLLSPEELATGVTFAVPLGAALTLPLQARLWPALELTLSELRQRAARRARLRRALESDDPAAGMIVRVEESVLEDRSVRILWRRPSGDREMRGSWDALPGVAVLEDEWYLLDEPVVERRAKPGAGYRGVEHEEWVSRAAEASPLGDDLEAALDVPRSTEVAGWLYAVPVLVCASLAVLGGVALAERSPPRSGEPVPADGLVARLPGPRVLGGHVAEVESWPPLEEGDGCTVAVEQSSPPFSCRITVTCSEEVHVYPLEPSSSQGHTRCLTSATGHLVAEDTSDADGDPALRVDTPAGEVVVTSGEQRLRVALSE